MGIDYTFALCVGFQIPEKELFFKSNKNPGKFHFEDRFDPKTGVKLKPSKVWDQNPYTQRYLEIDNQRLDHMDDPEEITYALEQKLDCHVSMVGNCMNGNMEYTFTVNDQGKHNIDEGRINILNTSMDFNTVCALAPKLEELKNKLEEIGLHVGEPKIFISSCIG